MNTFKEFLVRMVAGKSWDYIRKDPETRTLKFLDLAEKMDVRHLHARHINGAKKALQSQDSPWIKYLESLSGNLDSRVMQKMISNLLVNSGLLTLAERERMRKEFDMNVPWAVLLDPTNGCNLKCKGCWALDYSRDVSLSYETMDRIITEGKQLGIYFYIFSGGEPLLRKNDIISLCDKHHDCYFSAYTNGTLIDEALACEMARVANFSPAISIEGFREETDMRRGRGTFDKVVRSMDLLRRHGILFGASVCYHRYNTGKIASEDFIDFLVKKGVKYAWVFTYIPIGKGADTSFIATPEQREMMYHKIREYRKTKPIFTIDFWNDGEYVGGCIAAGRKFLHINAGGMVEPCAFIHYSNVDIHNTSLFDALNQPLFREFHKRQPFNHNLLCPCPALDNPDALVEMVRCSSARPTHLHGGETAEELAVKCRPAARDWAPVARRLWGKREGTPAPADKVKNKNYRQKPDKPIRLNTAARIKERAVQEKAIIKSFQSK